MKSRGDQAEQLAADYLQKQGLKLLEKNYRCRFGEIDLILLHKKTLVFAEVRLRKNQSFGGAASSITAQKQARIVHTAQHYLSMQHNLPPCRFDVVLLNELTGNHIEWIQNAFGE